VTDVDAYPLEYEFGSLDANGVFRSWITQTSNEFSIAVPPGHGPNNILTLRMKVIIVIIIVIVVVFLVVVLIIIKKFLTKVN
jgi:hypothetical protein